MNPPSDSGGGEKNQWEQAISFFFEGGGGVYKRLNSHKIPPKKLAKKKGKKNCKKSCTRNTLVCSTCIMMREGAKGLHG